MARQKGKRYIWMMVTSDEYELPIVIADSSTKLAKIVGTDTSDVCAGARKREQGRFSRYVRIELEPGE